MLFTASFTELPFCNGVKPHECILAGVLVNSQVLSSILLTLKSQITPIFVRPEGVKMSELETSFR